MSDNQTRKRGAPRGNRNALKHGYYSRAIINKEDRHDLALARSVTGLDEEIAVLRFKLKSVLQNDPDNIKLIADALIALNRLMRTRSKFPMVDPHAAMVQAYENIFRIYEPLGKDLVDAIFQVKNPPQTES
ncbi:MAG: hypothetical protein JW967_05170 [Dehalococcoidales bacterium]|nr:hypothetical protein [Dehalococcoidales bacterium]